MSWLQKKPWLRLKKKLLKKRKTRKRFSKLFPQNPFSCEDGFFVEFSSSPLPRANP
jgi:hypothetical protein